MTIAQQHIDAFKKILGDHNVLTSPEDLKTYGTDWTKVFPVNPGAVALPASTEEVSAVLKYCYLHDIKVVPSGGRTGLASGAVASEGELVLSLVKMNKIEEINLQSMHAVVQAGVLTQALQEAAKKAGVFFALDLASKGSCQIGGNIATNAGGLKLIKYGGMREQVLGIEVVLANGDVLDMNTSLRKNNTGYDLKQLFISSEGTLGIITRATLRLTTLPKSFQLACLAVKSDRDILQVLEQAHLAQLPISAFEFFADEADKIVCHANPSLRPLFSEANPYYLLLEIEADQPTDLESFLERLAEKDLLADAIMATNDKEFKELWSHRELISESVSVYGSVYKNDVSIPIHLTVEFLNKCEDIIKKNPYDIKIVLFGHIGDGNVHLNYVGKKGRDYKEFVKEVKVIEKEVFAVLNAMKGSISAEHGIGMLKKADLSVSRSEYEIEIMRQIKRLFDPKNILNPGKIF